MKITGIDEGFLAMSNEDMVGRRLFASPQAAVIHITIQGGRAIAPHATDTDMEFFVLEGRGVFTIGTESAEAGPNVLVEGPKGLVHGIMNPGPGALRVLAIKNGG